MLMRMMLGVESVVINIVVFYIDRQLVWYNMKYKDKDLLLSFVLLNDLI